MRHYFLAVSLILAMLLGNCQQLKADDEVPDVTLRNILNWGSDTVRLSAVNKKLIVLDFWSFNCLACLEAFPEIDSLQKEFDTDIQFIAVNNESAAMTQRFMENHPRIHFPAIPFVAGDTTLTKFFPRAYSPWHVWIDSALKVRFITDGYNATKSHIRDFLNRNQLSLNQLSFNKSYLQKNTLLGDSQLVKSIQSYSYIARCVQTIAGDNYAGRIDSSSFRLSEHCSSLLQLLQRAFQEKRKYDFSFPSTYQFPPGIPGSLYDFPVQANQMDAFIRQHCYSYYCVIPVSNAKQIYKIMQRDITGFFQLDVKIKKRWVDCYALVRIIKSAPVISETIDSARTALGDWNINNQLTIPELVYSLNSSLLNNRSHTFIIDETKSGCKISLAIEKETFHAPIDIKLFNEKLKALNLKLVTKRVIRDVMVITQRPALK